MSDPPGSVGFVGDLLTFSIGPRRGLRRGTRATDWYEQGCALEARDPEAAMAAYRRALAGRPDLADAHNNLGRLHHDRRELSDAESCYRLAICVDAQIPLYWFNLGVALEDQGRCAEAIAAYERALELEPASADAHFNLARLLELGGRRADDEVLLRRAVRHLARYRDLTRISGGAR
jgi:tetratricopeptide (TPR) repeat protein